MALSEKTGRAGTGRSPSSPGGSLGHYLKQSKDPLTSLILVLPLFLLYQIGVLFTDGVRNGVDFVTSAMMALAQGSTTHYLILNAVILAAYLTAIERLKRTHSFDVRVWPGVIVESAVYALLFGTAIIQIMQALGMGALLAAGGAGFGLVDALVLSLGAGLYEETVFRVIGVSGVLAVASRVFPKVSLWALAGVVIVASSAVFSAIHYVGSLGDAFTLGSFMFRFIAGILLALLYYTRGFAVAVYTHALYDILVMVFRQ